MKIFFKNSLPHSFIVCIGLILGIWNWQTGSYMPIALGTGFALWIIFNKKFYTLLAFCMFFTAGAITCFYKNKPILEITDLNNIYLEARVLDKSFLDNKMCRFRTLLFVEKIYKNNKSIVANCRVYVYTQQRNFCWVDDSIICGPVSIKCSNEKGFSSYLQKEGIAGSIFCEELAYKKLERPQFSLRNWFFWQRELLQIKLFKKMSLQTFGLFSSLFMGNKNAVASKLMRCKNDFKTWGISHYLARSGLHLIIFILIWNFLFNFLSLSFRTKHLLIFLLTISYTLFSWLSVSFIRAVGVYFLYKIATLLNYQIHALHMLSVMCIGLLLYNPLYLFALDFQLSFLLSFCLLWIAQLTNEKTIQLKSVA
jgi:ComEC/Rec2-related protein